jgi:hypothetical protein
MDEATFLARYPRVWHLAHGDAWAGLQRHGLLSTQRLLELFEREDDADLLLGQRRPDPVVLEHPMHGSVVLRDQHPLNVAKLQRALQDGMDVEEWLRLLNRLVFFFPSRQALEVLASAYADEPQLVLTLNTRSLVAEYGVWVKLASINTGSVLYNPAKRGRDTFLSIARHDQKSPSRRSLSRTECPTWCGIWSPLSGASPTEPPRPSRCDLRRHQLRPPCECQNLSGAVRNRRVRPA